MPRGQPKACTNCGRTHWSVDAEECGDCRKVFPSKRRSYGPRFRVLDHDLPAAPSVIRSGAGRCLGASLHGMPAELDRRCRTHWRHLSHRHCPTVGCGRAMAAGARQCGACTALELLEREQHRNSFASLGYSSEDVHATYLADMQGLPVAVAL